MEQKFRADSSSVFNPRSSHPPCWRPTSCANTAATPRAGNALKEEDFLMSNNLAPQSLSPRRMVTALQLGAVLGAGGVGLALSGPSFAAPPISVTPVNPQAGFAPLVAKVKPAVVQIATTSRVQADADD